MPNRNPFMPAYLKQMEAAGLPVGVAGDPFSDYLTEQATAARKRYLQRLEHHPGLRLDTFFKRSPFSPERLAAQYAAGGGTPTGGWQKRGGGGGDGDLEDIYGEEYDTEAMWGNQLTALGLEHSRDNPFDQWLRDQYGQANLDWREALNRDPNLKPKDNPDFYFTDFLKRNPLYANAQAMRNRFFSMDPSLRGGFSERYIGPGRTVAF